MTEQKRRAEPSPEARELLAHHDRLDLAEMVVALHQLEEAARTELAHLREGEEPAANPAFMPTPAQWIWKWNRATPEKRLQVAEAVMRDGATASDCRINGHTERIHDGRHAEMALNEVRDVVADMERQGALQWAGWLRDAMKRGPKHCLLCAVEAKPEPARGPAGTEGTEEQQLVHALGGDRTAKTIAHTLTVHGHTLDAVRTMTYAELLAVPGIGGPSLARIRAALDGAPEPDGTDQAEAEEQPLTVPRSTATALHEALGQLLGDEGALAAARVRALHHDWEADPGHCAHCNGPDGNLVPYPCPTIIAIDGQEQH